MKRSTLIILVVIAAMMQYCRKSETDSATTTTPVILPTLGAYINDTIWTPTTYNAKITYTASAKNKIFAATGVINGEQVNFNVVLPNASSVGNGFPLGTFNLSSANLVNFTFSRLNGSNVYVPQGTVKGGTVIVTAVDSVKMTLTGTFNFNTVTYSYDTGGNVTSLTVNAVAAGQFNTLPYTYAKQ